MRFLAALGGPATTASPGMRVWELGASRFAFCAREAILADVAIATGALRCKLFDQCPIAVFHFEHAKGRQVQAQVVGLRHVDHAVRSYKPFGLL